MIDYILPPDLWFPFALTFFGMPIVFAVLLFIIILQISKRNKK